MSSSTMNINMKYHTKGSFVLANGEIVINTPQPGAIVIPGTLPQVTTHVIMEKGVDSILKNMMSSSPVSPFGVNLYDQCGNCFAKYEAGRASNGHGSVKITVEPKILLSNIEIPHVPEEDNVILVLTSYSGLQKCLRSDAKRQCLTQDIEQWRTTTDISRVTLFTTPELIREIDSPEFTSLFKQVHVMTTGSSGASQCVALLCESLFGVNIAGSKPSFQGMLYFGPDTDVVIARHTSNSTGNITQQIRRGGRIQINTDSTNASTKFFAIIKTGSEAFNPELIVEETTQTKAVVTEIETTLTPEQMDTIIDGYAFLTQFNEMPHDKAVVFCQENASEVVRYLFTNPFKSIINNESTNEFDRIMISYTSMLKNQIDHKFEMIKVESDAPPQMIHTHAPFAHHLLPLSSVAKPPPQGVYQDCARMTSLCGVSVVPV